MALSAHAFPPTAPASPELCAHMSPLQRVWASPDDDLEPLALDQLLLDQLHLDQLRQGLDAPALLPQQLLLSPADSAVAVPLPAPTFAAAAIRTPANMSTTALRSLSSSLLLIAPPPAAAPRRRAGRPTTAPQPLLPAACRRAPPQKAHPCRASWPQTRRG